MPELFTMPNSQNGNLSPKEDKLSTLQKAKDDKVEYHSATLESLYDVDSPRFVGVTGGVGGTEDDGTIYDRTGMFSADRIKGIDSYEVFPESEKGKDYLFNDPRGIEKLTDQRTRLAESRNVPYEAITNEDVFEEGAKGTLKTLALLQAYDQGDEAYIQQVRDWDPSSEATNQWRTSAPKFGSSDNPLNINVQRAFLDEYGYYGRPLSQVKGTGSDYLIGQEGAGYAYDEDSSYSRPLPSLEDLTGSYKEALAEDSFFSGSFFSDSPAEEAPTEVVPPTSQRSLEENLPSLKELIGRKESSNDYTAVNRLGYAGKYQFGDMALQDAGYKDAENNWTGKNGVASREDWLKNPEAQEEGMDILLSRNLKSLKNRGLDEFLGKNINGVLVTEEGAAMSAHLIGAKGTMDMLKSGIPSVDANGVSGFDYMSLANQQLGIRGGAPAPQAQQRTVSDFSGLGESYKKALAKNLSFSDRLSNAGKAFLRTISKEVGLDFADVVGEGINAATNGRFGWDLGTEEEKTARVDRFFGFNPYATEEVYAEAKEYATNIYDGVTQEDKEVSFDDVYSLVKIGVTTPELFGDSLGFIASFFVPLLGWGGKAQKANKVINSIEAKVKAGTLTKAAAKREVQDVKSTLSLLDNVKGFAQNQAGLLQVASNNVNDQIDAYKEEFNEDPSVSKVTQMLLTESVMLGLDRFTDLSILKSPAALKGFRDVFTKMTPDGKAKVLAKAVTASAGLVANMGKEAGQEYLQEIGQEFNVKFNFDDNTGNFLSAETLDEAKEVFFAKDMQILGITGAGLGAGGALQFAAVGAPAALSGFRLKGKDSPTAGDSRETFVPTINSEGVSEEQAAANQKTASANAQEVVRKYSNMMQDAEAEKLISTENLEEEGLVSTPLLKSALKESVSDYRAAIDEIEQAEASTQDEASLKLLRRTKREIYNNFMEDSNAPTLGSGYAPEDLVEEFLDTVEVKDGVLQLSSAEEQNLEAYTKANKIPPLRFMALRSNRINSKDASEVQEEALGRGERSASTYNKNLKNLVNSPNPDRKAVAKIIGDIDYFLNTQENRQAAFDSVVTELSADIKNFNSKVVPGKNLTIAQRAEKAKLSRGKEVPGYKGSFVAVTSGNDNRLRINKESLAVSKSIKDNIDYLTRIKTRYGTRVNTILGNQNNDTSSVISVRPNSAAQALRAADKTFYTNRSVNKAIIDKSPSKKWDAKGDYTKDNSSRVNSGTYAEADVVVVNSIAKVFKKGSTLRRELVKVRDAKAAVVLDSDKEVQGNQKLRALISSYGFVEVTDEKGNKVYLVKEKAGPLKAANDAARKEKTKNDNIRKNLKKALIIRDSLNGVTLSKALKDGLITQKDFNFYAKAVEDAQPLFKGGFAEMVTEQNSANKEDVKALVKKLINVVLKDGVASPEYNEALATLNADVEQRNISKRVADSVITDVTAKIEELSAGGTLLVEWKKAQQEAKKGNLDFEAWLKENVNSPMKVAKDMLSNAIGSGRKTIYAFVGEGNDFTVRTSLDKVPKNKDGSFVPYQELEVDASRYLVVNKATPLNTLSLESLKVAGRDSVSFNAAVDSAVALLKTTIRKPNLEFRGQKGSTNNVLDFANSPASSLIFNKDLEVNENVAVALNVGLKNYVKNNGYLLEKGKKSKKDLSEILGIDESQISRETVDLLRDKGLLYKTAANSIGKDVVSLLGLGRKSDSASDQQAFDALVADLGQTALLMGSGKNGFLELDNSLDASTFAKTVLRKANHLVDDSNNAKVLFIQVKKGKEEELSGAGQEAAAISEVLPDSDASRKEPSFTPISKKRTERITKKMRKEKLGLKIADASKKALNALVNTEWTADLTLMREMVDNKDLIKSRLGYLEIGSSAYEDLSFEEKEVQPSVNRSLDKSFDEMEWLLSNNESNEVSLWFEYFFSKNGRFFIDSNTLNPQNDKHLHRFAIQPVSHKNTFRRKNGKFYIGKKDVSNNVKYAIAQGFGFAGDKQDTDKINNFANTVLKALNTPKKIAEAKQEFLETGKVADLKIGIEHLGHGLQTFAFLEKSVTSKGAPFTSSLSAEFDAVTSGFGIKGLQMPIVSNIKTWLQKVGVMSSTDPVFNDVKNVSMNDVLDSGEVKDSYETLGADVEPVSFTALLSELGKGSVISDNDYSRNLWEALSEVLPKKDGDGTVSKALRNLFKPPFMTFNYSASIKSIRKNLLTGELLTSLTKSMAAADLNDAEDSVVKLMQALVGPKGSIVELQDKVRSIPLQKIKPKAGVKGNLDALLGQMIEASYGAQVEQILTERFASFVDAQKDVNNGFKAMFEVFSVSFEKKLEQARKEGAVSADKERAIYEELKAQWPMIKGPLTNMEEELFNGDGIGIYDTETVSPYGFYAGRKPSRANISKELSTFLGQDSVRVSQMVKRMTAAIAAGSVVPIHFIDGAIMAETINALESEGVFGITSIHDAIIPSLLFMDEAQKAYNKQTVSVNANYSFINEIVSTLDSFLDTVPLTDKAYKNRKVQVGTRVAPEEVSAKDFLLSSRNEIAALANKVNESREVLYRELNEGAKVMHMAGTPGGVYDVAPNSIEYKAIEKYTPRAYNNEIKVNGAEVSILAETGLNIKCKG